ncbi:hypothetical protein BH11PSE11_BH11PSE11_02190 [soil metagenome]
MEWVTVPSLILVSALLLLLIYLQFFWAGSWASKPEQLSWKGSAFKLTKGQGYARDGRLTIEALDQQGDQTLAIAALSPKAFRAQDYTAVRWTLAGLQPGLHGVFLWRTVESPGRVFSRPLVMAGSGRADLELDTDKDWNGQIMGVALILKGELEAPVTVQEVSFAPASPGAAVAKITNKWFAQEFWQGSSINFLNEDALEHKVAFVPAIAALLFLSLALYALLAKAGILPARLIIIWCIVFFAWFILDARWQWNLFRQLGETHQQFAGKSLDDKHRAADTKLYEFMHQVGAKLPSDHTRVLYLSDDAYMRGKGAYYLFPHNVMASPDITSIAQLKPGEYVVTFAKKGLKYDASTRDLSGEGLQPVKADMMFSIEGNYLLKVR